MSIPAINTSYVNANSSYTCPTTRFIGHSFKVMTALTALACTITMIAAAIFKSVLLAVSAAIPLIFIIVAVLVYKSEIKQYETITRGEPQYIYVQEPVHPATPLLTASLPDPNYDKVSHSASALPGLEDIRTGISVTPPPITQGKPPSPLPKLEVKEEPKPVASPVPKKGLTSYFSRGASQ